MAKTLTASKRKTQADVESGPVTPPEFASLDAYLGAFAKEMANRVSTGLTPMFDPERDRLSAPIRRIAAECGMKPYPAQAVCVEALARLYTKTDIGLLVGEMGTGKAQPLTANVLTPGGWVRMGDIKVGDKVCDPETGGAAVVVGVFPQGLKKTYRVTFSDGSHTECCDEHLWVVNTPVRRWRGNQNRLLSLRQIMDEGLTDAAGNAQHFIPITAPVALAQSPLPVDPYLLGALIGDGGLSDATPAFSTADADMLVAIQAALPPGVQIKHKSQYNYRLIGECGTGPGTNPLTAHLRDLGLFGHRSETKSIPAGYKFASIETRLAVLQGLFDTDGSVAGTGLVDYSTCSPALADDVEFVVQSLGGTVRRTSRIPKFQYKGESRTGQRSYRLFCKMPGQFSPFRLPRKRDLYRPGTKYVPTRAMVKIEELPASEQQCIRLDSVHQTYLTDNCIVTHNSPMFCWLVRAAEIAAGRPQSVVLTAPNQLMKKWKRHFEEIMPGSRVRIVAGYKDLLHIKSRGAEKQKEIRRDGHTWRQDYRRWFRPTHSEVYIMPRDRGKLSYAWRPAAIERMTIEKQENSAGEVRSVRVIRYHCPKCGKMLTDSGNEAVGPEYFVGANGKKKSRRSCRSCNEPLWQSHNGQGGPFCAKGIARPSIAPRRVAPCSLLRSMGARFDWYGADEVHELKGAGTLQGQMFADLAKVSDKVVMLTGTLIGGYADNILHLLWRTIPWRLVGDGLHHDEEGFEEYIRRYGVMEERKRYIAKDNFQDHSDLLQGRGKLASTHKKSLPGISPLLFANFLLDRAVFIRLQEMHSHLPSFTERVHTVPLTEDVDNFLAFLQSEYSRHRGNHKGCKAWSSVRATCLRWPDKPWGDPYKIWDEIDTMRVPLYPVPSLEKKIYAKERRVARLVLRNKLRGRKTWVFTELTGLNGIPAWDWMDYIAGYMRSKGLRVEVLRSAQAGGPEAEDREEWIAKTSPGVDCIISHPALVRTGLDLFDFPSIVFAFPGDSTYNLRQASRRAWRLGQTKPCEVDYIVYRGKKSKSVQEAALSLMAKKMEASLTIEGDFSADGLAAMSSGEDMGTQLAKFIDGKLNDLEPASKAFDRYRRKLELVMPDLGKDLNPGPGQELSPFPIGAVQEVPAQPEPPAVEEAPAEPVVTDAPAPVVEVVVSQPESAPPPPEEPASAAPTAGAQEPQDLRERRRLRLAALVSILGAVLESDGDRHRFADGWYHLVCKHRNTVRVRNFIQTNELCPDATIAFVEPVDEAPDPGADVSFEGVAYRVSVMAVGEYMNGGRTAAPPLRAGAEA